MHKLRSLEKDGKTKSERIQQLQEKNLQAVVQTPGRQLLIRAVECFMDLSGFTQIFNHLI